MSLTRKLATFRRLTWAERRLVLEATICLAAARIAVLTVPFRIIVRWVSRSPENSACDDLLRRQVAWAIDVAAKNVPWNAVCLPQAMAAKAMLARRGCGSTFHLGAGFDENGKFVAHAWLAANGEIIVGAAGIQGLSPLAKFG